VKGAVVWLTGLSGAGKSTLAHLAATGLHRDQKTVEVLDGDDIRLYLGQGLGYTREDRDVNVHRIAYVARLLAKHDVLVFVAAISPYRSTRDEIKRLSTAAGHDFIEVYVNAPLETVEQRDVKGLYAKARAGEIPNFTGISDLYEPPLSPDIEVHTDRESHLESVVRIIKAVEARGLSRDSLLPPLPS
jgi:adenylyl-sulfate kinase